MLTRRSAAARKTGLITALALGILLCANVHAAPAAGADSVDGLPGSAALYSSYREAQERVPLSAQRIVNFNGIRHPADYRALPVDETVQSAILARLHHSFDSDLELSGDRVSQGDPAVLLANSDALIRTKVRLALGEKWLGFVYADMGAVDSELRWQGLAGIRGGHGFDLIGGWRHVTYHFSPGMGLDSLAFNGPFVGATLAW
jgi:hypothetical protein